MKLSSQYSIPGPPERAYAALTDPAVLQQCIPGCESLTATAENVYESISDEKKTAMGNGFFVTWLTIYRDQDGEVVGRQRFRTLRFKRGS